jgi:GR25 family glycosyltransferase involved in LPS biosynthesis
MKEVSIPTYIVNQKNRSERKRRILNEFYEREEFDIHIVEVPEHEAGVIYLWNKIKNIVENCANENNQYILICGDDHQFTKAYSKEVLYNCIEKARKMNADAVLGGVSWFRDAFKATDKLFWVDQFSGIQFLILFDRFFKTILEATFTENATAEHKIGLLSDSLFFIYPFVSTRKEYEYLDNMEKKDAVNLVDNTFKASIGYAQMIEDVSTFYKKRSENVGLKCCLEGFDNILIPTYIINLPERTERRKSIEEQFAGRHEFDISFIEACKHKIGAVGLWLSIRNVISIAMQNDDDVIVICEDDHEFTENYSTQLFLQHIVDASQQSVDYLSGGVASFGIAIPVNMNRYWVSDFTSTQFIVVYRKFFMAILDEPFDDNVKADVLLSEMTSNKMVLYPFISTQKDFGYSDVTPIHNSRKDFVRNMFLNASNRMKVIKEAYLKHCNEKEIIKL